MNTTLGNDDASDQSAHKSVERPTGSQQNLWWCGCGGTTKARFVSGHDSKFHSRAKKVARGLAAMPESFVNDDAKADFMKHHDAEKAKGTRGATRIKTSAPKSTGGSAVTPGDAEPARRALETGTKLRPALLVDVPREETLCIGLDFAWWGGGGSSRRSQTDTVVFARINRGGDCPLQLERIDLHETFKRDAADTEPNCDADAALVLGAVKNVIAKHAGAGRVVLAVDAPLAALDRQLQARSRKADRKARDGQRSGQSMKYRQCDEVARKGLGLDCDELCWRHVWNVQPGAPLCPRVVALVKGLRDLGFQLYGGPAAEIGDRLLFECFPGEALWSLGTRGTFAPYRAGEAKEYKQDRLRDPRLWDPPAKGWHPWPTVLGWVYQGLYGFADEAVLGGAEVLFNGWMADLTRHLLADKLIMDADRRRARRGKQLDDVVESVNCFLTAVSFVRNRAHVWIGEDPADGHIIGPGR